jgi:hypothetical protein
LLKGKDAKSTDLRLCKRETSFYELRWLGCLKYQSILGGKRMGNMTVNSTENLDKEWIELIENALEMGISSAEIRDFLHNHEQFPHKNI